ncbi:LuxR C-terminal-related transcriptional regulator [Paenibacillaceae bacterium WGS1546]|uniref:LuxR C-terminal-related transcriptional regulator n=1 Tax=Cohnella sp. WGS1546 TaxID=3366810 RepID=UPI00372CE924
MNSVEWSNLGAILTTKLHIPRPTALTVLRKRLIDRVQQSIESKITYICAPAGFGKSTLLAHWAHQAEATPAWFSVDSGDNDPARFWQYMIAAVDAVHPGFADKTAYVLELIQPSQYEAALSMLLSELQSIHPPLVLVLDDFHAITNESVLSSFSYFIEYLPANLHMIAASRSEPAFPTARLVVQQWMTRLDAAELRFTPQEGSAFYAECMALDLPEEASGEWVRRTEGWITAMKLAALSLQGSADPAALQPRSLPGNTHRLERYLLDEVFLQQSEETRRFLMDCSVLTRLSAGLCSAVSGYERSQEMLERLESKQLFTIPLDDRRRWYRFHQLFADFLYRRMERSEPGRIPRLLGQAGQWCEREGLHEEALDYYLTGKHYDRGLRLLQAMTAKRMRVSPVWLGAQFSRIPAHLLMKHPILYFSYVHMMMVDTRYNRAQQMLSDAEQQFAENEKEWTEEEKQDFWGSFYYLKMIHTSIVNGDQERTLRYMQLSRQYCPEGTRLIFAKSGIPGLPSIAQKFVTSDRFADKATNIAMLNDMVRTLGALGSSMQTCLAEGLYGYNELTEAERTAEDALNSALHHDPNVLPEILLAARLVLFRTRRAYGRRREAEETLRKTRQDAIELGLAGTLMYCDAELALYALEQGDRAAAEAWIRTYRLNADDEITVQQLYEYQYLARIYAALERFSEAIRLTGSLLEVTKRADRFYMTLELNVLQAIMRFRMNREDEALALLRPVLLAAEPRGYVRLFLDAGEPMAELLARLIDSWNRQGEGGKPTLNYVRSLLAGFGRSMSDIEWSADLALILTLKEREILELLIRQKTNREIAQELGIGYGTVRSHLHRIYAKLKVNGRAEAMKLGKPYPDHRAT